LSQRRLTQSEILFLQETLSADHKTINIRLREGEYQYNLAKAIASFQLELHFPDVKEIIKRLFGEEKTKDIQFIRKIQTILKKMQKSNAVKILPKKKPWNLQRYALLSFKFLDVDRNLVIFAANGRIKQVQDMLRSISAQQETPAAALDMIKICILIAILGASYVVSVWTLLQPIINPIIFVPAFSIAVACSIVLGKILSQP
jgi:hypothetical protein